MYESVVYSDYYRYKCLIFIFIDFDNVVMIPLFGCTSQYWLDQELVFQVTVISLKLGHFKVHDETLEPSPKCGY